MKKRAYDGGPYCTKKVSSSPLVNFSGADMSACASVLIFSLYNRGHGVSITSAHILSLHLLEITSWGGSSSDARNKHMTPMNLILVSTTRTGFTT